MDELRRINLSSLLMLLLQVSGTRSLSTYIVRDGDEATLSCETVNRGFKNCASTTWVFNDGKKESVELVTLGSVNSDRLSLSPNCSLVINKVTAADAGRYLCQQYISGTTWVKGAGVDLHVISLTEDKDEVELKCSLSKHGECRNNVKWLYYRNDLGGDVRTSQTACSSSLFVPTNHFLYESRLTSLTCEVTVGNQVQQFSLPSPPSTGGEIKATTESSRNPGISDGPTNLTAHRDCSILDKVMLAMRVVELVLITVITVLLIRAQGNRRPGRGNTENPDGDGGSSDYGNVATVSSRIH